jgi:DNA-binding XRE family transcriptional regulator
MAYPEPVQQFLDAVTQYLGRIGAELEETRAGHWWIDLRGRKHLAVEWRPGRGFGLSNRPSSHYGEGPAEIFLSPDRAARRVAQILAPRRTAPAGLAAVRELYGMTQQQLARKLAKGQPAISQIEKGRDSKLETIGQFIQGLGGHIEVRAVFRDGSLPISLAQLGGGKHATAKSARAARA